MIYFKNLHGLRFIAALLVIMRHCQFIMSQKAPSQNLYSNYFNRLGAFGVDLFFVISGFLITFLLLKELKSTGTIRVKYFYIRRILRIWPLYLGVGILGICFGPWIFYLLGNETVVSSRNYLVNLAFLFTFSVNFQFYLNLANPGMLGTLWSVCVEEQFYLIWAPMLKFFKKHVAIIIVVFTSIGLVFIVLFDKELYLFTVLKFYYLGLGAGLSYLYFLDNSLKRFDVLFHHFVQYLFTVVIVIFVFNIIDLPGLGSIGYGLFAVYIVAAFVHQKSIFNLENNIFRYLGNISYGLYVFHFFCIHISFKALSFLLYTNRMLFHVVFPLLSLCLTIIIASGSYYLFESYFLKKKIKYQVVP